jgi:hypothetical protein
MLTYEQVAETLQKNQQTYDEIPIGDDMRVILTERGGRVLGPFRVDAPGLLWMNPALGDVEAFRAFDAAGEWNMGGERVWVAPEVQFIIHDRTDFWGTHRLPKAIDPGVYTYSGNQLSAEIALDAYNTASGQMNLKIDRRIWNVDNPLAALPAYGDLMRDVAYGGYAQSVTLQHSGGDPMWAEAWNLVQLNPGGQLIIPCNGGVAYSPYFGNVPDDATTPQGNHLRINITGQHQYKIGYKATHMTGRMGYFNTLPDGRAYLLVRHFDNNPSNFYAEEPPGTPGVRGHSVHVYNDDGGMGGFGEMEASGTAINANEDKDVARDIFVLWAFVGPADALKRIGEILLGVTP